MYRSLYVFSPMVLLLIANGCGEPRPEGMPELYPCTITVTDGGTVLDDASISLSPVDGEWAAGAKTDAQGVAVIKTQAEYDGAAAGKYKVGISKMSDPEGPTEEEIDAMSYEEASAAMNDRKPAVSLVPDHLTIASLSPIEIEVTADGENKITIDIQDYSEPSDEYKARGGASRAE